MNKKALSTFFALTLFLALTMTLAWSMIGPKVAYAQEPLSTTVNIKIDQKVILSDGGFVAINDTVTLTKKQGKVPPSLQDFHIGFPYKYKFFIYQISAYDSQSPQQKLPLDLDVGLGEIGFYGVRIHFLSEVNLNNEDSYSFTLATEFAGLVTALPPENDVMLYSLDYPIYPSLPEEASEVNTEVFLPSTANYSDSAPILNQTLTDTFVASKKPLAPLNLVTGVVIFTPSAEQFNLVEVEELQRTILISQWNELSVSDYYTATNKAARATSTMLGSLPPSAYDIQAEDNLGNQLQLTERNVGNAVKATITLKTSVTQNETAYVFVTFKLPWKDHVTETGWNNFDFNFKLFDALNLTVRKLTVTVNLPEGAQLKSSTSAVQPSIVQKGIYEQASVFTVSNVSSYSNLDFATRFSYTVFWSSFRPALWTGALVAIVGAVAFVWQITRAPTPALRVPTTLPIRPEELRNYVKTYEDERKLRRDREALEAQVQKGKVPRRVYRVRSQALDSRLSVFARDLAGLKEKIRIAGPRYAEMMRQIEVAEIELRGLEADIRRTEIGYRRGEITAAAHHKHLEDVYRRRERAKTNIDGILLRLREEIT